MTPSLFPTHGDKRGGLHEGGDLYDALVLKFIPLSELPPSQSVLPTVHVEHPPTSFPSLRPTLPCSAPCLLLRLCTLMLLLGGALAACPGAAAPGTYCVGAVETLCTAGQYCLAAPRPPRPA